MRIFIDGDGCPVKTEVIKVANALNTPVTIVVDLNHRIAIEGVEVVTVDQGFDSADMAILGRMNHGDVLVTNDIGLASLALGKRGFVMDANGRELDHMNIDRLLFERHLHKEIRQAKGRHKGPKKRHKTANTEFERSFSVMVSRALEK